MKARTRWTFILVAITFTFTLVAAGAMAAWWLVGRTRFDPPKATLLAPEGTVSAVAYSPDGRHLTAGCGRVVRVWDRATWQLVRTLDHPTADVVVSVAYSPDGKMLASGCLNGHLALWDTGRGERRLTLHEGGYGPPHPNRGDERSIAAMCFSPDGRTLAAVHHPWPRLDTVPSEVRVWDTMSGKEKLVLKGHRSRVKAVAYSPDGTFLASGDEDGNVKLWDSADGSPRRDLPRRYSGLALAFAPKGGVVAYGGGWSHATDIATICDTATGSETRFPGLPPDNYATYVLCLAFSPDGQTLATGEILKDGNHPHCVRLWDVPTSRVVGAFRCPRQVNAMAFSPDGTEVVAGCGEGRQVGEVRVWDVPPKLQAAK